MNKRVQSIKVEEILKMIDVLGGLLIVLPDFPEDIIRRSLERAAGAIGGIDAFRDDIR